MAPPSMPAPSETAATGGRFEEHVGAFTGATLASRVLGYARDAAVAYCFGGGAYTDCYYAAFRIANFMRRALGEGAVSASFVPIYSRVRREHGTDRARAFQNALWTALVLSAAALAALGIVFARPIVLAITYGFASDPAKLDLTVTLTRLLFPFLIFITAAALAQGALFATRRFFLPALSPAGLSLSILIYMGLLVSGLLPLTGAHERVIGLAVAATVGSAVQWLIQLPGLYLEGLLPRPRSPLNDPAVKEAFLLLGPSLIGVAAEQIDALLGTIFASFLAVGSVTAVYNANRAAQLPLALIGISAATVALTHLSDHAAKGDREAYRRTLSESLRLAAFLLLPATAGLLVLAHPIVELLFHHGAFTSEESQATAWALAGLAFGVVGYGWTKVLVMAHYALKDAGTPVRAGFMKAAVNALLCWFLMPRLGLYGLMLAASISAWACAGGLLWNLHRSGAVEAGLWKPVSKAVLASIILYAACRLWIDVLTLNGPRPAWQEVASTIALALPLYYALAAVLGLKERQVVRNMVLRRKQPN